MNARNGGVEAQNGAVEGLWTSGRGFASLDKEHDQDPVPHKSEKWEPDSDSHPSKKEDLDPDPH